MTHIYYGHDNQSRGQNNECQNSHHNGASIAKECSNYVGYHSRHFANDDRLSIFGCDNWHNTRVLHVVQ